jgi:hypothetical protein
VSSRKLKTSAPRAIAITAHLVEELVEAVGVVAPRSEGVVQAAGRRGGGLEYDGHDLAVWEP